MDSDLEDKMKDLLKRAHRIRDYERARSSMLTLLQNLDHLRHDDVVELYNALVLRLAGK